MLTPNTSRSHGMLSGKGERQCECHLDQVQVCSECTQQPAVSVSNRRHPPLIGMLNVHLFHATIRCGSCCPTCSSALIILHCCRLIKSLMCSLLLAWTPQRCQCENDPPLSESHDQRIQSFAPAEDSLAFGMLLELLGLRLLNF